MTLGKLITVVNIRSLSYTGTTWINLLLGCHDRAFALGPPDRIFTLLEKGTSEAASACRIHGADCGFWLKFFDRFDPSENFYIQLAEASGRDIIVLNNPVADGPAWKSLRHRDIAVADIYVVRDGRAVVASYCRYHPEADYVDAIRNWFYPSAASFPFDPANPDALSVRYEDVASDPLGFLQLAGKRLGLTYPQNAHRFWEFEHHTVAGNAGTLATIRRHSGQTFSGPDREYREERYQAQLRNPDEVIVDRRWESHLGDRDRLAFDWYCGDINERWGYGRDRFTISEVRSFESDLRSDTALRPVNVSELHSTGRRLRRSLQPDVLRAQGLHLAPRDVKALAKLAIITFVLSLVLVATLAAIVF